MENKDISKIALERIKEGGIKPISRNIFNIKRVLFWALIFITLVVSALTFSLVLSNLFNNDWDLYDKYGFNFILKTLPYFWFVAFIIFIILGEYYYRKTLLGHRRDLMVVVGIYLLYTVFFGSLLYFIGVDDYVEQSLIKNAPGTNSFILNRHEIWMHPEGGLLSGEIMLVNDNEIQVIDINNFIWIVNTKDAFSHGKVKVEVGEKIKILGDKMENNIFNAEEIRPWIGIGFDDSKKVLNIKSSGIMR